MCQNAKTTPKEEKFTTKIKPREEKFTKIDFQLLVAQSKIGLLPAEKTKLVS